MVVLCMGNRLILLFIRIGSFIIYEYLLSSDGISVSFLQKQALQFFLIKVGWFLVFIHPALML